MKYLSIDTETTGLDSEKNKIIQLTMKLYGENKVLDMYIKHENYNWDEGALEFHKKINPDILETIEKEGVPFEKGYEELQKKLCNFYRECGVENFSDIKDLIFVGYNSSYDFRFVRNSWGDFSLNMSKFFPYKMIDVLSLVRGNNIFKEAKKNKEIENFKLETVANFLGITAEGVYHNSLCDVIVTEKIFERLYIERSEV